MLDLRLVERIATELAIDPGLVEKDWHVVRALAVMAGLDHGEARVVFSGGTSLSKGWELIQRFSEDIDFKIEMPKPASRSAGEKLRRAIRSRIAGALKAGGFAPIGTPIVGDEGRFMSATFNYGAQFPANAALRPELKVELTFSASALPAIGRQV